MSPQPRNTLALVALSLSLTYPVLAEIDVPSVQINFFNSLGTPVNYNYVYGGTQLPFASSPPPNGQLAPGATNTVTMPANFEGQATFNLAGPDPASTKAEFSLRPNGNANHQPFVDISFVDGYSVPMTCSCNGDRTAGCNKDLNALGVCPTGPPGAAVCMNPHAHETEEYKGPADGFFAPCKGAAYTYPADDTATMPCGDAGVIDCCVGTNCPGSVRPDLSADRAAEVAPQRMFRRGESLVRGAY